MKGKAALGLLTLALILLAGVPYAAKAASPPPSQAAAALSLTVVPPKLPADGNTFPAVVVSLVSASGQPSLALNDTTVFLTSSIQSIGSVTPELVIAAGRTYDVANFSTTTTSGSTTITAHAVGLATATVSVTTVIPSGFPTTLKVYAVPSTILAGPNGGGNLIVETLDQLGMPAKAAADTVVTLSSSNNGVVSPSSETLVVPSGTVVSTASYQTYFLPGSATITASASGFISGSAGVSVVGPSPVALKISVEPTPITTSSVGRIVITLTDASGNPARASSDVKVSITSSNSSVAKPTLTATISSGEIYAISSFSTGSVPGNANITASSAGLQSDFAVVNVMAPGQPTRLKLFMSPDPVLADSGAYNSVVVALTTETGAPAVATSSVSVALTSSNALMGTIDATATIASGTSYAVATFASTYSAGITTLTASAQDLNSATAVVSTYGPVPSRVVVQALPSVLPADGGSYSNLAVTVVDASGSPAIAPAGLVVQLASSRTDIASVNSSVLIPAGQTYALATVDTTLLPGSANITALASGYGSSSAVVSTVSPAPSQLAVYVAPPTTILSFGHDDAVLAVQLQDSSSQPALARNQTTIVVTASNQTLLESPAKLTIPTGGDYAYTLLTPTAAGAGTLTASASGLSSATAPLTVSPAAVSVNLVAASASTTLPIPVSLRLSALFLGSPVAGANVTFSASSGTMAPPAGVTDVTGNFTSLFVPTSLGPVTITAVVHHRLLGNATVTATVLVVAATTIPKGGAAGGPLAIVFIVLPVVIIVAFLGALVFFMRRTLKARRAKAEEEGEEEPKPEG